jgi:predicted secreted protein
VNWISGIAVYLVIWWVVLFAVLPFGVRRNEEQGTGVDPGAPENPRMLVKLLATTAVSAVLWLAFFAAVESGVLSLRNL